MSDKDKEIFFFDLSKIDWDEYSKSFITGIRYYLLNDPEETLDKARIKMKK